MKSESGDKKAGNWKLEVGSSASVHKSVLLKEVVSILNTPKGGVYFDGTINGGGHAKAIAQNLGGNITVIGFDQDKSALIRVKENLETEAKKLVLENGNFRNCRKIISKYGFSKKVNSILLDLGFSSNQLENSGRGFSFQKDEPLLMTMKQNVSKFDLTAREIVNNWDEENIVAIIKGYGEEKYGKRIARAIVEQREKKAIKSTKELSEIIISCYPVKERYKKIHPATKTFQALRIAVNDELESLKEGLIGAWNLLAPKGRIAVISFHSLEDRIVKRFFKEKVKEGQGILLCKKPIIAGETEIKENPRARSAKLRAIEKIND